METICFESDLEFLVTALKLYLDNTFIIKNKVLNESRDLKLISSLVWVGMSISMKSQ